MLEEKPNRQITKNYQNQAMGGKSKMACSKTLLATALKKDRLLQEFIEFLLGKQRPTIPGYKNWQASVRCVQVLGIKLALLV